MITNNCCGKKCSQCGECCGPFLPLTYKEIKRIKKAIKEHNITFNIHDFLTNTDIIFQCPFLDLNTNLCKLHAIDTSLKPEVCKRFSCSNSEEVIDKNRTYFDKRAEVNGDSGTFKPMDLIFFDSPVFLLIYAQRVLHVDSQEKLLNFLNNTGNKDIAEAILNGNIELEWSD
jgi:Fe-S-cluster containining protein